MCVFRRGGVRYLFCILVCIVPAYIHFELWNDVSLVPFSNIKIIPIKTVQWRGGRVGLDRKSIFIFSCENTHPQQCYRCLTALVYYMFIWKIRYFKVECCTKIYSMNRLRIILEIWFDVQKCTEKYESFRFWNRYNMIKEIVFK